MAELRAAIAIARKDLRNAARYPLNTAAFLLSPLYQFLIPAFLFGATFLVDGRAVGLERTAGTADVAGFLFTGVLVGGLSSMTFWSVAMSLRNEMDAGTLEPAWLTPTLRETLVLGRALGSLLLFVPSTALLLLFGVLFFDARFEPGALFAVPALVIAGASMVGLALLLAAAVLLLKEANFFIDTTSFLFNQLSGLAFPIAVLPGALQAVALALPTTYAIDIVRRYTIGARPMLRPDLEYVILVGIAGLSLPLGRWAFQRAEHRLRVQGSLGQH